MSKHLLDAVAEKFAGTHTFNSPGEYVDPAGKQWRFHIERGAPWDDTVRANVPSRFLTCWVLQGWDGYESARKRDWQTMLADFLGVERSQVRLGFGTNEIDVRPF